MKQNDYTLYFNQRYPGFFDHDYIRKLPPEAIYSEMTLELTPECFALEFPCPPSVKIGGYRGDPKPLLDAVAQVDDGWPQYFSDTDNVLCAMDGDRVVAFCLVEEMGTLNGRKVGGPGCVGTIPEYRHRGIALAMLQSAAMLLMAAGCEISYIHYTAVEPMYRKLGYRTVLRWNRDGIISEYLPK